MSTLADFLHDVLFDGRIHLRTQPADGDDPEAPEVLRHAYDLYSLSIAGPRLPLDEKVALSAARLLQWSAWYFLNPEVPIAAPDKILCMPMVPTTPEEHVSADLTLRFVPTLYRRAKAVMQNDVLPIALERVLREWPLSGVLADIVEPPLTSVDFGAHAGVNFLYAERLAEHERAGWYPLGVGMEYVELVWTQLGRDVSVLAALSEPEA